MDLLAIAVPASLVYAGFGLFFVEVAKDRREIRGGYIGKMMTFSFWPLYWYFLKAIRPAVNTSNFIHRSIKR